jgi:cell division protein FtsI (penicillin-binding protein 3)
MSKDSGSGLTTAAEKRRRANLTASMRKQTNGARRALFVGRVIVVMITLGMIGVLVRVGQLQLYPTERIVQLIDSQRSGATLPARRGSIVDRRERLLATTRTAQRLFVDPLLILDPNTFPERIAYQLDYEPATIAERLGRSNSRRYVVIDQNLSDHRLALLEGFRLPGLSTEQCLVRDYPQGKLAGQVIGFVGLEGRGLEGIELKFDHGLLGSDGTMRYWRDAHRRPLWVQQEGYRIPADGQTIALSIDLVIQSFAEDELEATCRKYGAESGQIVVMDPHTGEILALASQPFFNPQDASTTPADLRRNRCVTDVFEPGSAFKPFIWAAATEAGVAQPQQKIDCHGGLYVLPFGRRLRDAYGYGQLTWEYVLVKSSNIGMAVVGLRMGAPRMYAAVRRFGFGAGTGSGLPGEVAGLVNPLGKWTKYSVTSVPMGQEIAVTPLQLARAFCVFANGGFLVAPTIRRIEPEDVGQIVYERVLAAATVESTKRALRTVITHGTGRRLKDSDYAIFGKTGTAQVAGPGGYLPNQYTAVFVCGAPTAEPRIVVACVIQRPDKSKGHYGGVVAAPAAMRVIEKTLTYMGVAPRDVDAEQTSQQLARH